MDTIFYAILGLLALVYFVILFYNKKERKQRKSRQFMEGKRRHNTK